MKKHIIVATVTTFLTLLFSCSSNAISGHVDGTDTGIKASLVSTVGSPVSNASIRVYSYMDSTGVWKDSTTTDVNGTYSLAGLEAGRYTLWAETDSSALFLNSLVITSDSSFSETDTLTAFQSVSVPVKIQPNHDPRTVEVEILGTPIRHNVNNEGLLVLDKIPAGTYFMRLTSTLDSYSPTNDTVTISTHASGVIDDTLEMIYTGIPVVTGIIALYDTLTGVSTIGWDGTDYRDLSGYLIYRDPVGAINLSTDPIAFTANTVYRDTIDLDASEGLVYRIAIRANNNNSVGPVFYKDTIQFVNSLSSLNLIEMESGIAYEFRDFNVEYNTPDWLDTVKSVDWSVPSEAVTGSGVDGRISFSTPSDTLYKEFLLKLSITGSNNRVLTDSVRLVVHPKIEQIAGKSGVPHHSNTPVVLENSVYLITDEYRQQPTVWKAEDGITWEKCATLDETFTTTISNLTVWRDSLWFVTGNGGLYKSADGVDWQKENQLFNTASTLVQSSIINYKNKLYIVKSSASVDYYQTESLYTLFEYDQEPRIIPLSIDGKEAAESILLWGYDARPIISQGGLFLHVDHGSGGKGVYEISLGTSNTVEDMNLVMGGAVWSDMLLEYKNYSVLDSSGQLLKLISNEEYPKSYTTESQVFSIETSMKNPEGYIYNDKLLFVTSEGVFCNYPQ